MLLDIPGFNKPESTRTESRTDNPEQRTWNRRSVQLETVPGPRVSERIRIPEREGTYVK